MSTPVFIYLLGQNTEVALEVNQSLMQIDNLTMVSPFAADAISSAVAQVRQMPDDAVLFCAGDGVGANLLGYLSEAIQPRAIAYMAAIWASNYTGKYPYTANVINFDQFYGDWLGFPPGSKSYKMQPADWAPTDETHVTYQDDYTVNGGRTHARYIYATDATTAGGIVSIIKNRVMQLMIK